MRSLSWSSIALVALAGLVPAAGRAASTSVQGKACSWSSCTLFPPGLEASSDFSGDFGFSERAHVRAGASYGSLYTSGTIVVGSASWPFTQPGVGPAGFDGVAAFEDELTASGGSGSGTATIHFRVFRSGRTGCDTVGTCISGLPFLDTASTVDAVAIWADGARYAEIALYTGPPVYPPSQDDVTDLTTDPIPFTFGQPFGIRAALVTYLHAGAPDVYEPGMIYNSQGELVADFVLTGIELLDEQGHGLPDATLSSASGHAYPVPEPAPTSGAIAAALGLVLAVGCLREGRAHARSGARAGG